MRVVAPITFIAATQTLAPIRRRAGQQAARPFGEEYMNEIEGRTRTTLLDLLREHVR